MVRFGDVNVANKRCTTSWCSKAIIPAILDAAERLVPVLADEKRVAELSAMLQTISTNQGPDAVCRAIQAARDRLDGQSWGSENRPDRVAIGLVLDLVETYYAHTR